MPPAPPSRSASETSSSTSATSRSVNPVQRQALTPPKRFKTDDPRTYVTSLDFDDTGELAVTCRTDDTLQFYNCKEGKWARELKSQKYGVNLARFSHHSQAVIYASTKLDDTIRYLSTHDNSYKRYFRGHTARVTCLAMCPSSDEFLSCSEDGTARIWDLNSSNAAGVVNLRGAHLAAYDPTATVVAFASPLTCQILLYDLRNFDHQPFSTIDVLPFEQRFNPRFSVVRGGGGVPGRIDGPAWSRLEFSNDGKNLLLTTAGEGHYVIDSFDGNLVHLLKRPGASQRRAPGGEGSRVPGTGDACFTVDGQFVVGGSGLDDGVLVWDVAQGRNVADVLKPAAKLPFNAGAQDRVEIVGYNPRFNLLCTADRNFLMWTPDAELAGA
jgi:COMPASS component SWD2